MAHGTRPHGITRRDLLPVLGAAGIAAIAPQALAVSGGRRSSAVARTVYVGTYTAPGVPPGGTHPSSAVGIYVFKMNPRDGNLNLIQVAPASNPSFLALNPSLNRVYSVNEDLRPRQRVLGCRLQHHRRDPRAPERALSLQHQPRPQQRGRVRDRS